MNRGNQIAHTIQLCCQRHKQFPLNSLQGLQMGKMNEYDKDIIILYIFVDILTNQDE